MPDTTRDTGPGAGHFLIYVTASDVEEAKAIGRSLVEARLAACANVFAGMTPIFWWEGTVQEGSEAVLIAKTRAALVDRVVERVREEHSYECPAILAIPIETGNPAFLDWIDEETEGADAPDVALE